MLDFSEFQQHAEGLYDKLIAKSTHQRNCFSFFESIVPSLVYHQSWPDAAVISTLAKVLGDEGKHQALAQYICNYSSIEIDDRAALDVFKRNVLAGAYIFIWARNESIVSGIIDNPLVEQLQKDLGVPSHNEINKRDYNTYLTDFSLYCTYMYQNKQNKEYSAICKQLGDTVQLNIHELQNKESSSNWLRCGFNSGFSWT